MIYSTEYFMKKKEFNCVQQFPGRKQKSKSFINSEEKKNYERERERERSRGRISSHL